MSEEISERISAMQAQSKKYAERMIELKKEIADAENEIRFYCTVCGVDPDAFLSLDMARVESAMCAIPDDDNKLNLVQSTLKFCEGHKAIDALRNEVLEFQRGVQELSAASRRNVIEKYGEEAANFVEALVDLIGPKSLEEIAKEGCV